MNNGFLNLLKHFWSFSEHMRIEAHLKRWNGKANVYDWKMYETKIEQQSLIFCGSTQSLRCGTNRYVVLCCHSDHWFKNLVFVRFIFIVLKFKIWSFFHHFIAPFVVTERPQCWKTETIHNILRERDLWNVEFYRSFQFNSFASITFLIHSVCLLWATRH